MKIIPALQLDGWLATEHKSIANQIIVKYEFRSKREFCCRLCGRVLQHRGCRQLSIKDTPYNELDVVLEIETPILYCPHCNHYATIRPKAVHPSRGMTWRFMRRICELMVECSAARLAKLFRVSESSILRADKEMLHLLDKAYPVCMQGRRALIIDEKYLGRKKKFVTSVIDGDTGEVLWMHSGKGSESLHGFLTGLTEEEKESIGVVSIDRANAYAKAVREHLPHAALSYDPFHIIKNINDAISEVRRKVYKEASERDKPLIKGQRYLLLRAGEELDAKQDESLNALLEENAPLNEAYILKEQARDFLKMEKFKEAALSFGKWIELASNSSLAPFRRIAKTLARNAQCVLNYFRFRLSSGRIEGFNSMLARILFKARGLSSIEYLWLKIRERTSPAFSRLI